MDTQQPAKKRLDPETNVLKISNRGQPRTTAFIAKIYLKKFGNVELQAIGESTKNAVRVAENLARQKLVVIDKISSFTADIEGRKRVKLVVHLTLTEEGKQRVATQIQ